MKFCILPPLADLPYVVLIAQSAICWSMLRGHMSGLHAHMGNVLNVTLAGPIVSCAMIAGFMLVPSLNEKCYCQAHRLAASSTLIDCVKCNYFTRHSWTFSINVSEIPVPEARKGEADRGKWHSSSVPIVYLLQVGFPMGCK